MVLAASLPGLQVWADVAGVVLLIELCLLLLVVTVLIFALAFGVRWLHTHVVPVLDLTIPRAKQALSIANQGNDRIVRGIAAVYGFHQGLEAAIQALLRPRTTAAQPAASVATEPAATEPAATTLPVDVLAIPQHDGSEPAQRQTTPYAR